MGRAIYVGASANVLLRWEQHRAAFRAGRHPYQTDLGTSFETAQLEFVLLQEVGLATKLGSTEAWWIALYAREPDVRLLNKTESVYRSRSLAEREVALPNLRAVRERALLSQAELAAKSKVSRFTIQRIEARGGLVRGITARSLARALGVKPQELMEPDA